VAVARVAIQIRSARPPRFARPTGRPSRVVVDAAYQRRIRSRNCSAAMGAHPDDDGAEALEIRLDGGPGSGLSRRGRFTVRTGVSP
jgi:hypothetical protein